jgi:hypothetical protein
MIGSLTSHWSYTWQDIWLPLSEAENNPPDDLFTELYRLVLDYFKHDLTVDEQDEAVNDEALATEAFAHIKGSDFKSESVLVSFIEDTLEQIRDFDIEGYADLYKSLIQNFLAKYNLRYRIVAPFQLRLMLPGTFASLYADLERINTSNAHLARLMEGFERSFAHFARTRHINDLQTCISRASMYAEGIAGSTLGKRGSLGDLADRLTSFPHSTIKLALKNLYGFCSDYPEIRHAGNPDGVLRELETRDALLVCLLLVVFSGYLTDTIDVESIFGTSLTTA